MIQRFINEDFQSILNSSKLPRLTHICDVQETDIWPRILHSHTNSTEIVLVRNGRMSVLIDNVYYEAKKGDAIIYNSGLLHDERPFGGQPYCSYVCGINGLSFPECPDNWLPVGSQPVLNMGDKAEYMEKIYRLILEEVLAGNRGQNSEEVCQYLLCSLITIILSAARHIAPKVCSSNHNLSRRIKRFIDDHYTENINLATISESLQVSIYYLAHTFSDETGYSPIQYIIHRRMGEAQNLLIQTDLSIRRIAEMVGYENTSYFNKLFKKQTGLSPGKFREIATTKF